MFSARNLMFAHAPSEIEVTDFDKVDDFVSIPSSGLYDLKSLKITHKYFIDALGGNQTLIASRQSSGTQFSFQILVVASGNVKGFLGTPSGGAAPAASIVELTPPTTFGVHSNLEFTYDGVDLTLIVDGVTATKAYALDIYLPTQPIQVAKLGGSTAFFDGPIYNVKVGNISTVNGQWDNLTWEDQIASADGTITGSPSTRFVPA